MLDDDMIKRVAQAIKSGMEASDVVSLVANGPKGEAALQQFFEVLAMDAIEAMRELPSDPGPRYEAGEYSRRTQEAMVDDAFSYRSVTESDKKALE